MEGYILLMLGYKINFLSACHPWCTFNPWSEIPILHVILCSLISGGRFWLLAMRTK
ncbi:hypothetical protein RchiOBHm_Chr6g0282421 [Rosa chinensis]|uniref:Uncharacterized protein n=1 Tax=Rosa chinensis TaxID=74649 RepID=A0A2P6PTR8_ROSCH|nr:hypothetical protein RchiOBHm_Chr6g0282421 [Rosa chinensis]